MANTVTVRKLSPVDFEIEMFPKAPSDGKSCVMLMPAGPEETNGQLIRLNINKYT